MMTEITELDICKMCSEYNIDIDCEHKDQCKLIAIIRENGRLKEEIADLKLKLSYSSHNTIGDTHEMGAW